MAAEVGRMMRRDLATAFYPRRITADVETLTAEVESELTAWIGREEVSREDWRYRLVFRVDAGHIGLLRFEQMED